MLHLVIDTFSLPAEGELTLSDESGTVVDADVFEELVQSGLQTFRVRQGPPVTGKNRATGYLIEQLYSVLLLVPHSTTCFGCLPDLLNVNPKFIRVYLASASLTIVVLWVPRSRRKLVQPEAHCIFFSHTGYSLPQCIVDHIVDSPVNCVILCLGSNLKKLFFVGYFAELNLQIVTDVSLSSVVTANESSSSLVTDESFTSSLSASGSTPPSTLRRKGGAIELMDRDEAKKVNV